MTHTVSDAVFVLSARDPSELPAPTFAEVVFAGKSNVGKSSLLNTLLGRKKLARVSATPGCTRGINLFRVELDGAVLHVADLPGYGYAQRSKRERGSWGPMIEGYLRQRAGIALTVVIVDARRGLDHDDAQLLDFLGALGHPCAIVATKLDKLPVSQRKLTLRALSQSSGRRVLGFSAATGDGRDALLDLVLRAGVRRDQPAGEDHSER